MSPSMVVGTKQELNVPKGVGTVKIKLRERSSDTYFHNLLTLRKHGLS